MKTEFYDLVWTGTKLERNLNEKAVIKLDAEDCPPDPWEIHSSLGNPGSIWCVVYRAHKQAGGLFVMYDFEEILFIAQAKTNMAFAQGLHEFSQMVSDPQYATDIFDNDDDDDDDDDDD